MIGHQFGNYTTLALLGEGGMGSVYLAEHPAIGRRVAIKVLKPDYARDEVALGRFVNEARAANAIRHPNIIEILDSGTTGAGLPYLVMELLEGEPLRARLRRVQRLPALEALDVAYLTASALAAAHARGIVHRDLKPDNLFLVPDPNDPQLSSVKVLDFGIAKLQRQPGQLGERDGEDSVQTQTGTLVGTPSYMSPEQCLGTKALDGRTDIYSLGVILFEMLCGRTPFQSMGFGELVHLHLNVAPPRPRAVAPEVPAAIEEIILRALAKRPEERFQSMEELMSGLEDASGGWLTEHRKSARRLFTAKLMATPKDFGTPAAKPAARGSATRRLLLLSGVGVVAAAGGWWWQRHRRQDGARAVTPPVPPPPAESLPPPPPVGTDPAAGERAPAPAVTPPEPRPDKPRPAKPVKKPDRKPRPRPDPVEVEDGPAKM